MRLLVFSNTTNAPALYMRSYRSKVEEDEEEEDDLFCWCISFHLAGIYSPNCCNIHEEHFYILSFTAVELRHIHSMWTKKLEGKFTTSGVCLIVLVPNNLQVFAYVFSTNFYLFMVPGNCKIQFVDTPTLIHMLHICDVYMISITGLYLTVICANEWWFLWWTMKASSF